jgi:hypothetical protein
MKKTILTVLAASLMVASTAQIAAAAEHHHARNMVRAPVSDRIRNATNAVAQPGTYSDATDGHALSAPAGR